MNEPVTTESGADMAVSSESKNMAVICHVLTIFFGFIPSLIFYLAKTDDAYVRQHSKESLNFCISYFVYYLIAGVLTFVLIGILLLFILGVLWLVFNIIAAIKASKGELYKMPLIFRILK